MNKLTLVTGGCGFVGANLIAALREQELGRVRVLDNESSGRRAWIKEFEVEFLEGDIRDENVVAQALDGVDCVVHLAADTRVMDSIENPVFNWDVNVRGTLNILETMRRRGIRKFVNASTGGAIIGEAAPPVNEDMVARPTSPYGAAKLAVEGYCSAYAAAYGMTTVSLRFSNVYGPRSFHKGSVVAQFYRQILEGAPLVVYGDGTQTRDYVYVGDLVDGILRGMEAESSGVYQLGAGKGTSLNDLIALMKSVVGGAVPIEVKYKEFRDGEIRHTWCDISKAKEGLSYFPATELSVGLEKTWSWFCRQ